MCLALSSLLSGCFLFSPSPEYVYTQLELSTPYNQTFFSYYDSLFVCQNDSVELNWDIEGTRSGTLTAQPADAVTPFEPEITQSGTQSVTVNAAVLIRLRARDKTEERRLELIAPELCEGFALRPLGEFSGTLEQSLPSSTSLKRNISLWVGDDVLFAALHEPEREAFLLFSCEADAASSTLSCFSEEDASDFTLELEVSAEGLDGSYSGSRSSSTSVGTFSGSATFTKIP